MKEYLATDTESRGQVGIGTLIIFIALVLVAAVAAGVLIDTSGQLESRASDTGADAQAEVSNQVEVVSATGIDTSDNNKIDEIELVIKKSAGSDPIDLSSTTIQYNSGSAVKSLEQGSLASDKFSVTSVVDDSGEISASNVLANSADRAKITIDADAVEGSTDLSAGSDVDLKIVDQSGASTVYGVNVPDVLTGKYVPV
ncbi:archaellin/type IV pilin N-terminal domain-containing protein [Salinirussus salinus]|uniref:archaellin/type IV pilin N-terminal domain-containing protein n=1 Tax=Salinirussus salinus TaxID=1198300 RepID=UPI001359B714|nr:archaellin/type IV pilin N-terminal domain-containing protein [Salinirussus salinus]